MSISLFKVLTRAIDQRLSTDVVIVSIPIPLLWKVKLTLRRKLIIGLLLCSGVFMMVATLLRCILSLRDINGINTSTIWAIRETVCSVHLPYLLMTSIAILHNDIIGGDDLLTDCVTIVRRHYRNQRCSYKATVLKLSVVQA